MKREEDLSLSKAWKPLLRTLKESINSPSSKDSDTLSLDNPESNLLGTLTHYACETDQETGVFRLNLHNLTHIYLSTKYLALY